TMRADATRTGVRLPRMLAAALVLALAALAGSARAPGASGRGWATFGAFCDSCPDPVVNTFGVEFRRGELWSLAQDGTLTRLSACQPVQVIAVQDFRGLASGLGWDSKRDQFVVADALLDTLYVV